MLNALRRVLSARQGMILITGPTGSGKTTVLYAALTHLNRPETNILTVEDPVEMDLPGVGQVQVLDRAGRTFAGTLRSMLRQDPDVIMVGEMRDLETAEIACRAALTGHLVLSTLHTQSAIGTLTRLFDMGVAPYLAAASVNAIVAQRLARRVCNNCARPYSPPLSLRKQLEERFGVWDGTTFRAGAGCSQCLGTGKRGRLGVYELLVVDDDTRALMMSGESSRALREHVMQAGFRTIEEDAYRKACRGLIPPEEILALGMDLAAATPPSEAEEESELDHSLPGSAAARPQEAGVLAAPLPAAN
jgi:type II secretory ATPase GspE/PulE/Tfp pilus assembly ATPase PilB-like protein